MEDIDRVLLGFIAAGTLLIAFVVTDLHEYLGADNALRERMVVRSRWAWERARRLFRKPAAE